MKTQSINDQLFPVVVLPEDEVDTLEWAQQSREKIRELLNKYGALLFRDHNIKDEQQFERFVAASTCEEWVDYREAATPRSHVNGNVFTSTEYPPKERIFFHNENSHTTSWPLYLAFYCEAPPIAGGETPLCDCRRLSGLIPEKIRQRFEKHGILYSRSFGYGVGIPWQKGFPVTSRVEMEQYCLAQDMTPEWQGGDKLKIRYRRPAVRIHPVTHEEVWFNHATFFNCYSLTPETRALIDEFIGKENAPYNTYYGDGEEISEATIEALKDLYQECSVKFSYQAGDVLLIDNMLMAHGREPFEGYRKILVTMTKKISGHPLTE